MIPAPQSFTVQASGRLASLITKCAVAPAFDPATAAPGLSPPGVKEYAAVWDTGATNSAISQSVIDALGLKPISRIQVETAGGTHSTEVYLISIGLPNGVGFATLRVSRAAIKGADVLIGMDIIGAGDFAVTNVGGKTSFSYRFPSMERIDFVKASAAITRVATGVERNQPCPCGSGKKYKKCCGDPAKLGKRI
jgi:predicted aspartyl protease